MITIRSHIPLLLLLLIFSTGLLDAYAGEPWKDYSPNQLDSINKLDTLSNRFRYSNNALSKKYAHTALEYAKKIKSTDLTARSYILLGLACLPNNNDSSFFFFEKAIELAKSVNDADLIAHAYYCLAALNEEVGDYETAVILLDSVSKYASISKDERIVVDIFTLLGNIRFNLKDNDQAKSLYLKSYETSRINGFNKQCGIALSNLARFEKDPLEQKRMFLTSINYFLKENGSDEMIAATYTNLADKQENPDSVLMFLNLSLKYTRLENMPIVQMAAYNAMAYAYLDKGDLRQAESCLLDKAIPIGIATDNEDWLSTLYDSYTDILMAKGDFKSAAIYAKKAIASMVEADQKKASRQVRLLASILDVKNKELTISVREQELLIERAKVQKTRLWLFLTLLLLMGAMASVWWIRQRGRMKLQREQIASARKIIELDEREKSTVARDLHDLTGQMQVAFMGCFHNIKGKDDEVVGQAKMQIHEVGDRMRRLSHRLNSNMIGRSGITSMIREMCEDIEKMTNLKVSFVVDELASLADEAATLHLYRIIQEMLTNATKFIREGEITLHLLVEENRILLSYADPGPGFNPASQPEGMGLMNIYERVKLLQGEAILNSAIGQGTSWEISCPNRQNSSKI